MTRTFFIYEKDFFHDLLFLNLTSIMDSERVLKSERVEESVIPQAL